MRERVGQYIFGVDKEPIEPALLKALRDSHTQLAISETGTGGLLAQRLSERFGALNGQDMLHTTEQFASVAELRAHLGAADALTVEALAESAANALRQTSGAGMVLAVVADSSGTAISVNDGIASRNRAYGYHVGNVGGGDWVAGWGVSMAWLRLVEKLRTAEGNS
mgnify:CR=1 FL=1